MALEWNTIPGIYGGNTENGGRGGECVDPHGRAGAFGFRAGEIRGGEAGARRRAGAALCAERRRPQPQAAGEPDCRNHFREELFQ